MSHLDSLHRLEEVIAFTDRRVDELHEGMLDLAERLQRIADRLSVIEHRLNNDFKLRDVPELESEDGAAE